MSVSLSTGPDLAADVPVQRAGYHAEAGGDSAHAEGLHAVGADDRERLGDNALAGERKAAAIPSSAGPNHSDRASPCSVCRPVMPVSLPVRFDCERCSLYSDNCT
jgi:hypothetical protein